MARSIELLSVFVASPSDVDTERKAVKRVIEELNLSLAPGRNQRLDLIGWETHVRPAISTDPQQAINDQLPDNHDFIIAIFWTRLGTPTPRAASGTLEEIERAIARRERDPDSVELMLYFKDDGVPLSDLDTVEYQRVKDFKASLAERGILYKKFLGGDFEGILRIDIARALSQRATSTPSQISQRSGSDADGTQLESTPASSDEDAGYEDLILEASADLEQAAAAMERIATLTDLATSNFESRSSGLGHPSTRRDSLDGMAADLQLYSESLSQESGQLAFYQERALSALAKSILLAVEDNAVTRADTAELKERMIQNRNNNQKFDETLAGTQAVLASLPRITRSLNIAKRGAVGAIESLRSKLQSALRIQESILTKLETIER